LMDRNNEIDNNFMSMIDDLKENDERDSDYSYSNNSDSEKSKIKISSSLQKTLDDEEKKLKKENNEIN